MPFRLDDLPAEKIRAALALDVDKLPDGEASIIQDFIQRIGGRENAELALAILEETEGSRGGFRR
jgi:hypothetical protein